MFSILTYKWVHLSGLALTLLSLGGLSQPVEEGRKWRAMAHGTGLLLALVGGFGMLARLKISAAEPWVISKIVLWLILGGSIALFKRKPELAKPLVFVVWGIFMLAAYVGLHHGFGPAS
jgi:hypothetical protein